MRNPMVCGVWLLWGVLLAFVQLSAAQDTGIGPVALTRDAAMARAARQHPQVAAAASREDAARERIAQARSGFRPQVSLRERYSTTTNPMWAFGTRLNQERISQLDFDPDRLNAPDPIKNLASTLSLRWPVYDAGRIRFGFRQARDGAAAAERMRARSRQQAMARAAMAYDGWLLARARLAAIDRTIRQAEAHRRMIADRHRAGFVVKSDFLRAQVRLSALQQQRLEAESGVAVATAHLGAAMGESPDRDYEPADELVPGAGIAQPLERWITTALRRRPEMAALERRQSIAQAEVDKRRAAHMPSVSLFGDYQIDTEDISDSGSSYTVGALLQLDLYSGGRDAARTREALAGLTEMQALRRELETGIRVETRQAFLEADSAWHRIAVARAEMAQAEAHLDIVTARYRGGLATVVTLLDAESVLEQARLRRLQAVHDFRTAQVRLRLAAGELDGEAMNAAP